MAKIVLKIMINGIIWLLSCIVPKTEKIVVIGGWFGNRFADNSKAIFLFLSQNKRILGLKKIIFVSRKKEIVKALIDDGYESLFCNSISSVWFHFRSKIHIIDDGPLDLNGFLSMRTKRINLWHGFPLKKIGYYMNKEITSKKKAVTANQSLRNISRGNWQDQYLLAYSNELSKRLQFAFGLPQKKIIFGAYPRIVYMLGGIKRFYFPQERKLVQRIESIKRNGGKIIFYLPTFRDVTDKNDRCIKDALSLEQFFEKYRLYLLIKMHYAALFKQKEMIKRKHIINLDPEIDVYNFLDLSDVLVTDYSSVYLDYLFINKPIIFYCFDKEDYINNDRGLLYPYEQFTPGDKVAVIQDLKNSLYRAVKNPTVYNKIYEEMKTKIISLIYERNKHGEKELYELWANIRKGVNPSFI